MAFYRVLYGFITSYRVLQGSLKGFHRLGALGLLGFRAFRASRV